MPLNRTFNPGAPRPPLARKLRTPQRREQRMPKLTILIAAVLAGVLFAVPAWAATQAPYDQQAVSAAQIAGKPILIAVHAPWCPTCAKQDPIIKQLSAQPEFKDLMIFVVDFDSQKDVLKALNVQKQSTLIALNGKIEKDRATGITDPDAIKALLMKTKA